MARIPLDDPIFAPGPPSARGERTPLEIMAEIAALEEQNILFNKVVPRDFGQEVANPPNPREVPITEPRKVARYRPEGFFQTFWEEAKELGIAPPASDNIIDLLEYQTRASKRAETLPSWWNQKRFKDWGI